jgi:hypothetical protein
MDGSSALLVRETSCGEWRRLQLGDVRRTVAAPIRGGEQAFLHGLSRSLSWGALGVAPAHNVLLQWALGAWPLRPLPQRGSATSSKIRLVASWRWA